MTKKKDSKKKQGASVQRYAWRPASRFTALDPQVVGEELEKIRQKHGTHMTADHVVAAASDPESPLYEAFQWDDEKAAHEHRLSTARTLMRSVNIVIITPERKEIIASAFVSTPRTKPNARHYTTTAYAMADPELRAHVLRQALSELAAFRRKYAELSELALIFQAIDKTRRKAG